MKTSSNPTAQPHHSTPIALPVAIGAVVGLIIISFFVFGVDQPDPNWPKLWFIRPLMVTPLAGAMGGGAFYYLMDYLSSRGFNKMVAVVLSVLVFFVALWLGIVLGLDRTMWD